MLKRLLTGIVLIILLVPVFIFYDTVAPAVLFALIAVTSTYETAKCVGINDKKHLAVTIPAYIISASLPFFQYTSESFIGASVIASAALIVFIIYAAGVFGFRKNDPSPIVQFVTMIIYIGGASVSFVSVAGLPFGGFILPLLFLGSWGSDTFAYCCGSLFGRHKLIPKVSPKKTVEGSVGAVIFTVLFFALYGYIVTAAVPDAKADYTALVITALFLSILSQIGDLNASFIKRIYGIKDYGNIFPGHGGMLDRFDSVIAIAPILYILSLFVTYFS